MRSLDACATRAAVRTRFIVIPRFRSGRYLPRAGVQRDSTPFSAPFNNSCDNVRVNQGNEGVDVKEGCLETCLLYTSPSPRD